MHRADVAARRPQTLQSDRLELNRKAMKPLRPVGSDLDRLCEDATGLAAVPFRVEQIDVKREHHARRETVAHDLDGFTVRGDRVVPVTRIFQRGEAVAADTALADSETTSVDLVLHRFERR